MPPRPRGRADQGARRIGTLEADRTTGHPLLEALGIPHDAYQDAPADHRWDTAWLAPALQHLLVLEADFLPEPSAREE
ncbi:hypothetical protein [Streptomyces diastaticus]|uniref:hypothetical protein n=1 Tax=Streptomyces diastaticus TaxID=1956 RepID=UPI00365F5981